MRTLSLWALAVLFVLSACQKSEELSKDMTTNQIIQQMEKTQIQDVVNTVGTDRSECAIAMGPFTFETYAFIGCVSDFGFCKDLFPFPPIFDVALAGNQAYGNAYLDRENQLVLEMDGRSLSDDFIRDIKEKRVFTVSEDYNIPASLLAKVYDCEDAGNPPESMTIPAGEYPVDFQAEQGRPIVIVIWFPVPIIIIIIY